MKKIIFASLFLLLFVGCTTTIESVAPIPIEDNGAVPVNIQDYNGRLFSYFLTKELQLTTLTTDAFISDFNISVDNATGCLVGDAIDLWDDNNYFQGLITDVTGSTISFVGTIVHNFSTTNTVVKCGEWNLNVDGSVNKQTFSITPPTNSSWDLESCTMQFKDNSDWDINTFGSRTSLQNGFTAGIRNGELTRLFLIYNNGGFALRGFDINNIEKAPSGLYGFTANLDFETRNGAIPALHGLEGESFLVNVNDDLTSQTELAFVVRGHYKDD